MKHVCEVCGQGPDENVSLFRTGEKGPGKDPHWRCQIDLTSEQRQVVSGDVAVVVAIVEDKQPLH